MSYFYSNKVTCLIKNIIHQQLHTVHWNCSMTHTSLLIIICSIQRHIQASNKTSHQHHSILKLEALIPNFHRQHCSMEVLQHLLQVLPSLVESVNIYYGSYIFETSRWFHRLHTKNVFHHKTFINWVWIFSHHNIKLSRLKLKTLLIKTYRLSHHNSKRRGQ